MNRVMVVLGIALLAAGLVVGFAVHVHSNGFDCGVPFGGAVTDLDVSIAELRDKIAGGSGMSGCADARASAKVLPIVLLVVGLVALIGAAFVPSGSRTTAERVDA